MGMVRVIVQSHVHHVLGTVGHVRLRLQLSIVVMEHVIMENPVPLVLEIVGLVLHLHLHLQQPIVETVCATMERIVDHVLMTVLELHNVIIAKQLIGNDHPGLNAVQIAEILVNMLKSLIIFVAAQNRILLYRLRDIQDYIHPIVHVEH